MARRRGLLWLAVACLAATAGCPGYTSGIRRGADVDTRFAYLYGRFLMNAPSNPAYAFGHTQSMGFLLRCQDGSEYVFGSRNTRDIQVLKIRASRCWLIEAQMAAQGGQILKRLPAEPPVQRPLDFVAGRAYYIGDYFAKGDFWRHEFTRHWEWAMSAADDRYESAECEAACPAGQCLPYRGDTGPAMACVIRCDRDADCPDGLACNCPNSERSAGPGCRSIATALPDAMARICLSVEAAGQRR
jgi:hypothetical protein